MFSMSRILFPVDFSAQSAGAAHYAAALACRFHAEVHIVHVIDLRVYGLYGMADDQEPGMTFGRGCLAGAEQGMDGFLADRFRNLRVTRKLLYGDPADEIVKYAATEDMSLIVMPTHARGRFRRFLLGSVTAKVLHDTECPIWTGAHMETNAAIESVSFGRILCALDLSERRHPELAWACRFSAETGGALKIVHAVAALHAAGAPHFREEIAVRVKRQAEAEIQKLQEAHGCHAAVEILAGETCATVCAAAKEWEADVMVIGRGVMGEPFGRLRSGSYGIIRESPCPVVSL